MLKRFVYEHKSIFLQFLPKDGTIPREKDLKKQQPAVAEHLKFRIHYHTVTSMPFEAASKRHIISI